VFHKNFGNNGEEGGTHGSALSLLVADSIKIEEGGGQTNFDMFRGFKVKKFGNKVNGFRDRDFGEMETTSKLTIVLFTCILMCLVFSMKSTKSIMKEEE